jgi:trimethylamine--corrinoid protein Co-methyltransferase
VQPDKLDKDSRGKRRARRGRGVEARIQASTAVSGGRYSPLGRLDLDRIHAAVLELLADVGLADAPALVRDTLLAKGGSLSTDNRLLLPPSLVQAALAELPGSLLLAGRHPRHDLELSGRRVYVGSGGAAPLVVDLDTDRYRPSTLADLYDAARMVDALDNVHFFSRSVVARDMETTEALDINTAYASLAGTTKHVMVSANEPAHVRAIAHICHLIAGSEQAFRERPFLSLNINHVVPPLRFIEDACDVLAEAVRLGIPAHVNTFGQMGASSPVTIAGCVAQTMAETVAGLVFAWALDPAAKLVLGVRPMVTDLRTGGMAGGAGEQALLTAAVVQMAQYYGLPNSTIAGATDSKINDAQSGYEKSLSVNLAAQTGANLITQACGMQAGLMGCSFESYVVDNEMLGVILRSMVEVQVDNATLSPSMIGEVVRGDGHFLGHADTLERMQTDFLYPQLADRRTPEEWEAAGSPDIRRPAKQRARDILATHFATPFEAEAEAAIRAGFDIRLPASVLRPA